MAEVIHVVDDNVIFDGVAYTVQVCGRPRGNIWEGWIEFASDDGADTRRTRRETTQPNREALEYWADGLSGTYLEGAFARTLERPVTRGPEPTAVPFFDAPLLSNDAGRDIGDRAVLNPFSVGAKGERLLRQELEALRDWHLRNIIRAYKLAGDDIELEGLSEPELIEIIVSAVQVS